MQGIATIAIWLAIVVLPLALPFVLIALLARLLRRRNGVPAAPARPDAPTDRP